MYKNFNQTKLKSHVKNVMEEVGECDSLKDSSEVYKLFMFMFKRHPEYPVRFENMVDCGIQSNAVFSQNLEAFIINKNGERDVISILRACVSGKAKNSLAEAMRYSIAPQIQAFKDSSKLICVKCKNKNYLQVDHMRPEFIEISSAFLKNKTNIPNKFDNSPFLSAMFQDCDNDFMTEWNNYHESKCKLQILCKTCNTKKPRQKRIV